MKLNIFKKIAEFVSSIFRRTKKLNVRTLTIDPNKEIIFASPQGMPRKISSSKHALNVIGRTEKKSYKRKRRRMQKTSRHINQHFNKAA